MVPQTDVGISRRLGHFVSFCSVLSIAIGLWALTGRMLHLQAVENILPGSVAVNANAAICFVLIGLGLWAAKKGRPTVSTTWNGVANVAAATACLVGLLSLLEYFFGWNLGIDQMSPTAAFGFLCLGSALLLLDAPKTFVRSSGRLLPCLAAIASMFCLLDFVLNPATTYTHFSLITPSALFLLSFAVMFTRPESGLGVLFASANSGGTLTRWLFPAAIVVPLLLVWLRRKGQASGLYSDWAGLALMTVFAIVVVAGLAVWTGFLVERRDWARRQKEEIISSLASIFPSFDDAIIATTLDGTVTSWNPGAAAIHGYSAQEMIRKSISITVPLDRREEFAANMRSIREGEHVPPFETTRVRKDGKIVDVLISVNPVRNRTGRIVGASTNRAEAT